MKVNVEAYLKWSHAQDFTTWNGEYDKVHYDVLLPDGELVKHCWPNAGKMCAMDSKQRSWTKDDGIKVRVSPTHPLEELDND